MHEITCAFCFSSFHPGCSSTWTSDQVVITSPNYPNNYANNLNCHHHIIAGIDQFVQLRFTSFQLETGCYDSLAVYDGSGPDSRLYQEYCGYRSPFTIRSTGNEFYLIFKTDESVTFGGFEAELDFIDSKTFFLQFFFKVVQHSAAILTMLWSLYQRAPSCFSFLSFFF